MERVKKLEKQHGRISRYMGNGMYEKCGSELERPYPSPSKEKAYAKKAMQNLVFKKEEVEAVQDEIKWLHDTMGAGMIVNE